MSSQVYQYRHRVTYAECTVGNHIYYANYLAILEAARGEFFRSLGRPLLELQNAGVIFPVVECSVKYRYPARYDDVLTVAVGLNELKGVRVGFTYAVSNQHGQAILEAATRHACATLEEKPQRIPEDLKALLAPFLAAPPPA